MPRRNEKLVTIAEFDNLFDADLAKLSLDNADIESVLMGEHIRVSLYHVFDTYIKLKVFESDAKRAVQLLEEKVEQGDG